MKKVFLVAMIMLASVASSWAQKGPSFRADVNFMASDWLFLSKSSSTPMGLLPSLRVGGAAEFAVSKGFYVAPGLVYSIKGFKNTVQLTVPATLTMRFHYLEIPINAGYRIDLGNKLNVSVEVGPYVGFVLFGTAVREIGSTKKTNPLFQTESEISRFDMGIGTSLALGYDRYYLNFGYERGLFNMSKKKTDVSLNNVSYMIGVGMRF